MELTLEQYRTAIAEVKRLQLELDCEKGVLFMAVARLGGIVEGNPTGRHNFLQRIDELVALEASQPPIAAAGSQLVEQIAEFLETTGCLLPIVVGETKYDHSIRFAKQMAANIRDKFAALPSPGESK